MTVAQGVMAQPAIHPLHEEIVVFQRIAWCSEMFRYRFNHGENFLEVVGFVQSTAGHFHVVEAMLAERLGSIEERLGKLRA